MTFEAQWEDQESEDAVKIFEEGPPRADGEPSPLPPMDEAEMLRRFVYLARTDEVCDLDRPLLAMSVGHFGNYVAASKLHVPASGKGKDKFLPLSKVWLGSEARRMVDTRTWRPGAGLFTEDPNGLSAVNIWTGLAPEAPPEIWQDLAAPFVEHVAYLVPEQEERARFLDWLAHMVQQPGQVPHSHYLMIAENTQGIGRNLLATFLHGALRGRVQPTVNLASVLDGRFNAELSEKLLAVVDELHEGGGGNQWKHAEQLKTELTRSFRRIKPKYGKEHDEYNCLRWLMFSNHTSALPLTEDDRRFHVIQNPTTPQDAIYYERLYVLADDPATQRSILECLLRRDISKFNPGERPPMSDMKRKLIQSTLSEPELILKELLQEYPGDLIRKDELDVLLYGDTAGFNDKKQHASLRHMLGRHRALVFKPYIDRKRTAVVALRNGEVWKAASAEGVVAHLAKATAEWRKLNAEGKF